MPDVRGQQEGSVAPVRGAEGTRSAMSGGLAYRKRRMNDALRATADDESASIAFFCECEDDGCFFPVFLTVRAYDRARTDPAWVPLWSEHAAGDDPLSRESEEFEPLDLAVRAHASDSLREGLRGVPLS